MIFIILSILYGIIAFIFFTFFFIMTSFFAAAGKADKNVFRMFVMALFWPILLLMIYMDKGNAKDNQ